MTLIKPTVALLCLLAPCIAAAQTQQDEVRVIETALQHHFSFTMPYVEYWLVSSETEPLTPGAAGSAFDAVRTDYLSRNESSLSLSELDLPPAAVQADLLSFSAPAGFDWPAFDREFPQANTYTARVARPGFSDLTHAVVRVDTGSSVKRVASHTTQIFLARVGDTWKVVGGESPAVR